MSGGQELRKFLSEMGYKSPTNGTSHLDWVFTTNEPSRMFLEWIINNLSAANAITVEELQEYNNAFL